MPQLTGANYLERRNEVVRLRPQLAFDTVVLVIDGAPQGLGVLTAVLHLMLGYDARLHSAATFGAALDRIVERQPDLIFLADQVPPNTAALDALPILRRCGYQGPVVVIGARTGKRHERALVEAGAADVLDRDQFDTVRVSEALLKAYAPRQLAAE